MESGEALFSYRYVRHLDPVSIKQRLGLPATTRLWIDSSGFQIGTKQSPNLSAFDVFDFQRYCSDVAFTLDVPGDLEQTYKNALLTLSYSRGFDDQLKLYAVITHTGNLDAAYQLARKFDEREFDGIAVGTLIPYGTANMNNLASLLVTVRKAASKPIHVLGVGGYDMLYLLALLDVESFDSSKFLGGAKWREYHLPQGGMLYIGNRYDSKNPRKKAISGRLPCECPVCRQFGSVEFFQQSKAESVAYLALHNFYVMRNEIRLIHLAKKEGWFKTLLEGRARKSIKLRHALKTLRRCLRTVGPYIS